MKAVRVTVRGRVQRVGYRRYLLDTAQEEGISGYVRNMPDGSVVVQAQGEPSALRSFLRKLKSPPLPTRVKSVEERTSRPSGKTKGFSLVSGGLAEEMQEGFGSMQGEFRDYGSEFKNFRSEFKDYRQEFRDYRSDFEDYRGEFEDYRTGFKGFASRTDDSFRTLGDKLDSFANRTDENFNRMNAKYGEISDKLSAIMSQLTEQVGKTLETLDSMRTETAQTAQTLNESLRLLREAVDRLPRPT
jgi:acylphosphatase